MATIINAKSFPPAAIREKDLEAPAGWSRAAATQPTPHWRLPAAISQRPQIEPVAGSSRTIHFSHCIQSKMPRTARPAPQRQRSLITIGLMQRGCLFRLAPTQPRGWVCHASYAARRWCHMPFAAIAGFVRSTAEARAFSSARRLPHRPGSYLGRRGPEWWPC